MAFVVFSAASLTVTMKNIITKSGGMLMWRRRVPKDMRDLHEGRNVISHSLGTKDPREAAEAAAEYTRRYDALWASHRSQFTGAEALTSRQTRDAALAQLLALGLQPGTANDNPEGWHTIVEAHERKHGRDYEEARYEGRDFQAERMLTPVDRAVEHLFKHGDKPVVHLTDARNLYLQHHRSGQDERFRRDTNRPIDLVVGFAGDLPLDQYTRKHARELRDKLLAAGLATASVRRRLKPIVAVFNKAAKEHGLKIDNPFNDLDIPKEGEDAEKRVPFTLPELHIIAQACRAKDDDIRHILALQLDTGARAGEIIGLRVDDVVLNADEAHVFIRPHKALGRRLKTESSVRDLPLVGESLWAAQRAVAAAKATGSSWLFGRYASDGNIKADYASNALNKSIRAMLPDTEKTTHCFRHSMRDRLREIGAPIDVRDAITGHGKKSIGEQYGSGHSVGYLKTFMDKVVLPPLASRRV